MGKVRVKPWEPAVVLLHPVMGEHMQLDRAGYYDDDDPMVLAHPWYFATDVEIADELAAPKTPVTSVPVEAATAAPGEKRATRRRAG